MATAASKAQQEKRVDTQEGATMMGVFTSTALVCDRCAWFDSCPSDTTSRVACSGPRDSEVYTDTTQGEFETVENEDVAELKVVPAYLPYPARRVVVDRRRYVLMTAPRRLQRGRNYGR